MIRMIVLIAFCSILFGCDKVDSICAEPFALINFKDMQDTYNPNFPVEIEVLSEQSFDSDQSKTLFSFSVPAIFIHPKGDYSEDVVKTGKYSYSLLDPANAPDSVLINVHTFNDCGISESISTYIKFGV